MARRLTARELRMAMRSGDDRVQARQHFDMLKAMVTQSVGYRAGSAHVQRIQDARLEAYKDFIVTQDDALSSIADPPGPTEQQIHAIAFPQDIEQLIGLLKL